MWLKVLAVYFRTGATEAGSEGEFGNESFLVPPSNSEMELSQ